MIKEEDRLAAVIAEIDHDVKVVPRGSFVKTATGQVNSNRSFKGKISGHLEWMGITEITPYSDSSTIKKILISVPIKSGVLLTGVSVAEAAKLCSYMHLREAESIADKSLLQKADMDMSIDFLDQIDEDIPKGNSPYSATFLNLT